MPQAYGLNLYTRQHNKNLIDNWSFETDITTGWTDANWVTAERSAAFSFDGRFSAHLVDATFDGDEVFYTDLVVGIVASTEYTLSQWVKKVTCTGTGTIILNWYTIADAYISNAVLTMDAGAHDWKQYKITATAPATAAKAVVYAFYFTGVTATTAFDAYIDGVKLYATITDGLAYTGDLTYHATGWKRSSRAIGGYWSGSFMLSSDTLSRPELDAFYNDALGCRIVETCYGMTSWEGMVWTIEYHYQGSVFQKTLGKDSFHNRIKVWYQDTDIDNQKTETPVAENTDSQDEYGT